MNHHDIMHQVLALAEKGRRKVSPNPMVGAMIIKSGALLSEGFHQVFGGAHAEINALRNADKKTVRGADLYVNLEPCAHHGKTPPCVDAIIRAGIGHVIYGMQDPNPQVAGKGLGKLREAGIRVTGPILEEACRHLNRGFISTVTKNRPYITAKVAQTLDGRIALPGGASKWITGIEARKYVHRMRGEHDAVLVGVRTVLQDDPELTIRWVRGVNPKKIILDSTLQTSVRAKLIQQDPKSTLIVHGSHADADKKRALALLGVRLVEAEQTRDGLDMQSVWNTLILNGVNSVLVEGGSKVFSVFLKHHWIDRLAVFVAPRLFGAGISPFQEIDITSPDQAIHIKKMTMRQIGADYLFEGVF